MRAPAALALALALVPCAARADSLERFTLRPTQSEGCSGVPFARRDRAMWVRGREAVDASARFWVLERPAHYRSGKAVVRYRVGEGVLRVEGDLSANLARETLRVSIERPIGSPHQAVYLSGMQLPCERRTRFDVTSHGPAVADFDSLAEFDARLLEATELLYDEAFERAERALERARAARPDDPAPYWMMARLRFMALESSAHAHARAERLAGYHDAERWADAAVERAPALAEGYLWRGIARGRIATTLGNLRIALQGMVAGRGPAWLEQTLRDAASLPEDFCFFGFGTHGDALHALAQFYRMAPDGWYMVFAGTRGDLGRAIELSRGAVALQPNRIEYRKELAVELLCRDAPGDHANARRELEAVLALPAVTRLDRVDQAHARRLESGSIDGVCWYSRDAFEVDAS